MLKSYKTVNLEGKAEHIIQKSRFIGYVRRTETEEEAQSFIDEIKRKHYDATHNCSAYLIGENDQIQKANDDGEPGGTAGVPILEVLKKQNLKDTTVVVTRYFGGVKLGAGGLIRAYGNTTSLALKETGVVQRTLMQGFIISIDYQLHGKIENYLRQQNFAIIEDIHYDERVHLNIFVEIGKEDKLLDWITNATSDRASIKKSEQKYIEVPL